MVKVLGHCFSGNLFSNATKTYSVIQLTDQQSYRNINNLNVTVATPPDLSTRIDFIINKKNISNLQIKDNTISVKGIFMEKGMYNIKIIGKLINEYKVVLKADTLEISIRKI